MPSKWDCFQSRDLFGLRAVSSQCKWIQTTTPVFTWSFKLLLGSFTCSFLLNSVHSQGNVLPPFLFPWVSLVQLCANIFTCISTKWGLRALKGQEPVLVGVDRRSWDWRAPLHTNPFQYWKSARRETVCTQGREASFGFREWRKRREFLGRNIWPPQ